jgi:hypothetical protein
LKNSTYIVDGFPEDQSAQLKVRRLSLDECAYVAQILEKSNKIKMRQKIKLSLPI